MVSRAPSTHTGLAALRQANRQRLLELLQQHGALHRAELARRSGLSRTTVSTIVSELLRDELIRETGDGVQGAPGRPAGLLAMNPAGRVAVGVDFSYRLVRVVVADMAHQILSEATAPLSPDDRWQSSLTTGIEAMNAALSRAHVARHNVVGVGIGLPGPIDRFSGVMGLSSNSYAWAGVNVAAELSARLGLPVQQDNTSHLGSLAETVWGAGRGCRNLVYIKLSSGVGSGLVLDGRIFRGAIGAAGEIGHITVDSGGPACRCGNRGCLEVYAGVPAVLEPLRTVLGNEVTIADVLQATAEGNRACRRVLADVGHIVGRTLAGVCNLLNPERIVVGGELAATGSALLDPVRTALHRHALAITGDPVSVVPGVLADRAGALGGVALVLHEGEPVGLQTEVTS